MQDRSPAVRQWGLLPHLQAFSGVQAGVARALRPQQPLGRIGDLEVRLAQSAAEIRQAQKLRYHVFYQEGSALADPGRLFSWYVDRFLTLRNTAFRDPKSYFHRYSNLSDEEARETAAGIWKRTNLMNLHENILPTRQRADLILKKGESHAVEEVALRRL